MTRSKVTLNWALIRRSLTTFVVVVAVTIVWIYRSFASTGMLEENKFDGIHPLKDGTTNIIIVHGIGHHCLGYADEMVLNLVDELTAGNIDYKTMKAVFEQREADVLKVSDSSSGAMRFNGECETIVDGAFEPMNNKVDLEALVSAQAEWCEEINEYAKSSEDASASCHQLYVRRNKEPGTETETAEDIKDREYVTGFIRRFQIDVTPDRDIQIYEVTWSPATRWIKSSLFGIEQYNVPHSEAKLNRDLKFSVVNSNIADAVAYLGDSGILVNYDVLQAFCLAMANYQSIQTDSAFACGPEHLQGNFSQFSEDNRTFLVTHSLGTRVVFDSLGLLARGVPSSEVSENQSDRIDLLTEIVMKFNRINAEVPDSYLVAEAGKLNFQSLMAGLIPELIDSIESIYVFTNQVPLLAANITSPLKPFESDAGRGFEEFLKLRRGDTKKDDPLQVVAFHDPDDLLSYNLSCWYLHNVLKYKEDTKFKINKMAEELLQSYPESVNNDLNTARFKVRRKLFSSCSGPDASDWRYRQLFESVLETGDVKIVDAEVRLQGKRLSWLAADPSGVHSNYFKDATVHSWMAKGFSGSGTSH